MEKNNQRSARDLPRRSLMFSSAFDNEIGVIIAGSGFPETRGHDGFINKKYLASVVDILKNMQKVGDSFFIYLGETLKPDINYLITMLGKTLENEELFSMRNNTDGILIPIGIDNILILSESQAEISKIIGELDSTHTQSLKWILNSHYDDNQWGKV